MKLPSKRLPWPRFIPASRRCARPQRILEVDGGYVVLCGAASGLQVARRLAGEWRGRHITLVLQAPEKADAAMLEDLAAKAAHACSRIVIYERKAAGRGKPGERAALLARAVRSSTRIECGVIPDSARALRHCIEGIARGGIVVYCCDLRINAVEILEEYGARAVAQMGRAHRRETSVAAAGPVNTPAQAGFALSTPLGGGL